MGPILQSLRTPGRVAAGLAASLVLTASPVLAGLESPLGLPAGDQPSDVVVCDFDRDGRPDLAVADQGNNRVSILIGHPTAGFAPAFSFPVAKGPVALVAADFDGDDYDDLAVACPHFGMVSLAINRGDGTFHPAMGWTATPGLTDVSAGDVDGDGLPDVVVTSSDPAWSVSWLRSLGPDGLAWPEVLADGFAASSLVASDLDGTGGLELVVCDVQSDVLRVVSASGASGGEPPAALVTGPDPAGLVLADVDGDGWLDALALHAGGGGATLARGLPGGAGFAQGASLLGGTPLASVVVTDVNGDTRPDLVLARAGDDLLSVLHGTAGGGFVEGAPLTAGLAPAALAAADLDGDHLEDVVVANGLSDDVSLLYADGPWVDLGGGTAAHGGGPGLTATGSPAPSGVVTLAVSASAGAQGWLVAGTSQQWASFGGGVLVPSPDVLLPLPPSGVVELHWPAGPAAGANVFVQAWWSGHGAGGGVSSSNALRGVVQDG